MLKCVKVYTLKITMTEQRTNVCEDWQQMAAMPCFTQVNKKPEPGKGITCIYVYLHMYIQTGGIRNVQTPVLIS